MDTIFSVVLMFLSGTAAVQQITSNGCDQTKGCFLNPKGCDPASNCVSFVTYSFRQGDGVIDFELGVQQPNPPNAGRYIAVGFSEDTKMGNDAVTACVLPPSSSQPVVRLSYNPGSSNRPIDNEPSAKQQLISNEDTGTVGGYIICKFSQRVKSQGISNVFDLDRDYNLLLAHGNVNPAGNIQIHGFDGANSPVVSSTTKLTESKSAGASSSWLDSDMKEKLVISHGCLMIFGWWLFGATAILFARYFKSMYPDTQPCGLKLWFHFHRGLNIIAVLAVLAGMIIIFIRTQGKWEKNENEDGVNSLVETHGIIGLTACIAAYLQPIMALFRCKPTDSKRPIFNWLHRILGIGAYGCAAATIWFATEVAGSGIHFTINKEQWGISPRALMIFYWASLVVVLILLEAHITATERFRRDRTNDIAMSPINSPSKQTVVHSGPKCGFLRLIILLLFVLIAMGVTIALACMIVLGKKR